MNEIEIKIKCQDLTGIVEKLEKSGCQLSNPKNQKDVIFINRNMKEYKIVEGSIILRTRDQDTDSTFTIKQQSGVNLSSKEFNLSIESSETLHEMLKLMGFRELVRVTKTRRQGKIGEYNICLDEVEQLGRFIELECLTERDDFDTVQKEMLTFLNNLGIDTLNRVTIPYDTQIIQLNNL